MTDWYQFAFGRPNPGRRAPNRVSRYLDDPATEPGANAPQRGVEVEGRGRNSPVYPQPPEWARANRSGSHVPLSAAAGLDTRPFGDDFAAWHETTRQRPLAPALRAEDTPAEAAPDPGYAPRNPNNVIADAPGGAGRRFDVDEEWADAVERARQRRAEGRPSQVDVFLNVVFGKEGPMREFADRVADDLNAGPITRMERENDDMQDELRGIRR